MNSTPLQSGHSTQSFYTLLLAIQVFGISVSSQANALDRWHWRNPSPPLNPLTQMAKINFLKTRARLGISAQDLALEMKYSQAALAERLKFSVRQLRRILKQERDLVQGASANWLFNLRMEDGRTSLKKGCL